MERVFALRCLAEAMVEADFPQQKRAEIYRAWMSRVDFTKEIHVGTRQLSGIDPVLDDIYAEVLELDVDLDAADSFPDEDEDEEDLD
ncbi:hypothetical protein [Myxococcus phage Mx1]|nr:hypothetical protein [Myxococcus phage Mx1]